MVVLCKIVPKKNELAITLPNGSSKSKLIMMFFHIEITEFGIIVDVINFLQRR